MPRLTDTTVVALRHRRTSTLKLGSLALTALAGLASGSIDLVVTGTSGTGTITNIGPMGPKPPAAKAEPFTADPSGVIVFKDSLKTKDARPCFIEPFPRAYDRQTGSYAVVVSGPGPFSLIDALYFDFSAKTAVSHNAPSECCLPWVNAADVAVTTSVDFEVSGLNPGQDVELRYRWVVGGQARSRDEGANEDSAQITNADFEVLVNGLAPPGPGQLPAGGLAVADPNTGTDEDSEGDGWTKFCVDDDDVITVNVHIATDSFNTAPGRAQATCPGIGRIDRDERTYTAGRLEIEIYDVGCDTPGGGGGPPPPIPPTIPPIAFPPGYEPPPAGPQQELLFSIDIGSDTEVSNTLLFPTAPPVFDPGDLYRQFGPPMPLPMNGVFDDEALLSGTAVPTPFGPYAPYCVFPPPPPPLPIDLLDLDGADTLDVDVSQFIDPRRPLDEHLPRLSLATQFDPTFLLVSFDDDGAEPYWTSCSVPFASPSPFAAETFGSTAERDEVVELFSDPLSRQIPDVPSTYEALSERGVHISLAGNPDEFNSQPDDDVDALDATWTDYAARYWYYSVDHEAAGDPLAAGLPFAHVPHSIYMADRLNPGNQRLVVDGGIHLGLRDGTDVDAFEFVVIDEADADQAQQGLRTALLFSVDHDDPTTNPDESGGLDPAAIYASFMDGRSFLYAETELGEDIDAIAAGFRSIAVDQYLPDPGPTPCNQADLVMPFGVLDIDDVLAFLDAFAQGDAAIADLTGDGVLDIDDVLQFLDAFARGCP